MVEMHLPVLREEVLHYLVYSGNGVYVDATIGDGGHAEAILEKLDPSGRLIGIDWDSAAIERAEKRLQPYSGQLVLVNESYTSLENVLKQLGCPVVNGILIDLGASTIQLMDPERGFSYQWQGDLDMRMDRRRSLTAEKIVNSYSAEELAELFFRYGEERWAKRVAARIVAERNSKGALRDSLHLAETVKEAIPARYRRQGRHPARKVFQALRLAVNEELENINLFLPQALKSLLPGGRLCVIAYHSLEDRLTKRYFLQMAGQCNCPPGMPCICEKKSQLKLLTRKAIKPSENEIKNNPRARSARLRAVEKV